MSSEMRDAVVAYYERLWSGDAAAAMVDHLGDAYVEHQYLADFSREGMLAYVTDRREAHAGHGVLIHHVLSDRDLVFLLAEENLGDSVDYARAELFRVVDGRIVEHWGSHVRDEKARKNANGTFDGPQVDRSTDYARRFAERFETFDQRGFDGQQLDTFAQSRTPEYRQHSPKGRDGLIGLVEILSGAKDAGIRTSMKRYRTLADGDFVVSHRLYDTKPTHPLMNRIYTFDMFRLDSEGRAVEHWDVMDDVPSADMLAKME
jgi:predicted SnoaL-like aldol condensation-catalyzing enzyme